MAQTDCIKVHGTLWWPTNSHCGPFDLAESAEPAGHHLCPIVSVKSLSEVFDHVF